MATKQSYKQISTRADIKKLMETMDPRKAIAMAVDIAKRKNKMPFPARQGK